MLIHQLSNAAAHKITVSTTAGLLESFIDTAASAAQNLPSTLDGVDLYIESGGDARIIWGADAPTSSTGFLLKQNGLYRFRGRSVQDLRIIRAGGADAVISVEVGYAQPGESESATYLA